MTPPRVDDDVIEACRKGDRDALRRIFLDCKDLVYSTAVHYFGGDRTMAADITQDVFVKLAERIGQYRGEARFTTWLQRITVNACLDEKRRTRRLVPLDDEPDVEAITDPTPVPKPEMARAVADALSGLNAQVRMTILLKYVDDLSYDDIAGAMGCSRGTVASRLNRGHAALARRLAHWKRKLSTGGGHV
ncbi:MAG TPA: RNA polymerase sigma factor [Candidatus Eisenbacteria bacterium]